MEGINILVIEHKDKDAEFLQQLLGSLGYKVWVARTVSEALESVKNMPFAVALTELFFPEMNGKDMTHQLLKIIPHLNILVMTTYNFINFAVEAMEEGAYGYITKPFNHSEVKIVVERAVERAYLLFSGKEKEYYADLSVKDGLTEAYNRNFLKEYLKNKIAMMNALTDRFSLAMIDIDHFKNYNDNNGHPAGDKLLKNLCKVIQASLRKEDILLRYGGEEFLVFMNNTEKKAAILAAERIRTQVEISLPVTISMGVGSFPEDGQVFEELISRVDGALYKAKDRGRNKVFEVGSSK